MIVEKVRKRAFPPLPTHPSATGIGHVSGLVLTRLLQEWTVVCDADNLSFSLFLDF